MKKKIDVDITLYRGDAIVEGGIDGLYSGSFASLQEAKEKVDRLWDCYAYAWHVTSIIASSRRSGEILYERKK